MLDRRYDAFEMRMCATQVGDQLDRGNEEIEIMYFLERLEREARVAGGALHVLNGQCKPSAVQA